MNYNNKLDIILAVLCINLIIFTLLGVLLNNINKYYSWIVSIFVLNIQTVIYYTFISWTFYKRQRVYKYYLISVILTSFLSGMMMLLHRSLINYDLMYVIIILLVSQVASLFDIIIYQNIKETFIAYKKSV
jgi:drug/metabolite transporter (DMT)-like permease